MLDSCGRDDRRAAGAGFWALAEPGDNVWSLLRLVPSAQPESGRWHGDAPAGPEGSERGRWIWASRSDGGHRRWPLGRPPGHASPAGNHRAGTRPGHRRSGRRVAPRGGPDSGPGVAGEQHRVPLETDEADAGRGESLGPPVHRRHQGRSDPGVAACLDDRQAWRPGSRCSRRARRRRSETGGRYPRCPS